MFPRNIPQLDLHGYDRESAKIALDQFLTDLQILKEKEGLVIHGIGRGILRKEVADFLKKDRRVDSFSLSFMNPGCTIIKLVFPIDKSNKK